MSEPRKIIPLVPVATVPAADAELHGCAELEPFVLRVIGDSMAPEFLDGHVMVLDPGLPAREGAFVVVESNGEMLFGCFRRDAGRDYLAPLNPQYPAHEIIASDRLVGVVIQRAGRRRADRKRYD
jgi:DNA polymerase V